MWKTTVWPLCSIFSNSGHVFQWIKNTHKSSMQDTLRNIYTKFGFNWSSSFRGEEFCIIVNDDNRRRRWRMMTTTPSIGNSSHGLWPGELKKAGARTLFAHFCQFYTWKWQISLHPPPGSAIATFLLLFETLLIIFIMINQLLLQLS